MTVIIILAPILVTAVQRIRERCVKVCFSAYLKMLDKLALMPKSFLIEGHSDMRNLKNAAEPA